MTETEGYLTRLASWVKTKDWVFWILVVFGIVGAIAVLVYLLKAKTKEKPQK